MRKLTIMQHISLDGIIQHSADDDNFPYPDWSAPYRTLAGRDLLLAAYGTGYDLLLGRVTYDIWAKFWPTAPPHPMGDNINAATKHIVTHNPQTLTWGPHKALGPNFLEELRELKSTPGPDLILCGSSTLTSPLLHHGIADDLVLIVYPILLGTGKRLFTEGTPAHTLELVKTQSTPTGVMLNHYKVLAPLTPATK